MARQIARRSGEAKPILRDTPAAHDGSTRFYRDCDALLSRHPLRLLACRLEVTGDDLGNALLGSSRLVSRGKTPTITAAAGWREECVALGSAF